MATIGIGYRTAGDVLVEISYHLCQPTVYQALASPITAGSAVTATVSSTYAMYPGALIIIDSPVSLLQEVVTVLTVPSSTTFTANFTNSHSAGVSVWGATFPTQQATDPIFTQSEMLSYLSRAQNEFLTAIPCYYERFFQNVSAGSVYQSLPDTAIMVDRVASSSLNLPISSMVRSTNVVTLTTPIPHGQTKYSTFSVANPNSDIGDDSFLGGAFVVDSVPSPTTLTYRQVGSDASTTGGSMQSMLRLYELSQEELTQQSRFWQSSSTGPLKNWFEDRAGLYRWGVGGIPNSQYPVELLCAIRDTDSLGMTDGFLVPDMALHGVKYLTMAFAYSKEGVMKQPTLADFCMKRYTQVVLATQRYIKAMAMEVNK